VSIKRTKQHSTGRRSSDDAATFSFIKPPEPEKSWEEHTAGQPDEKYVPYSLKTRYAKGALIAHPKFGKGVVVTVLGTSMEVLFSDGKKRLGHAAS
jgi:hypothetical protein